MHAAYFQALFQREHAFGGAGVAEAGGGDADGGLEAVGHGLTFVEAVDEACGKGIARAGGALAEAFWKGDGGLQHGLAGPAHGDGAFDGVDDDPMAHARRQ